MNFLGNALGRRIVLLMVLASAVLSLVAACVQLYLSYQRDLTRIQGEVDIVETSFRGGLETALWSFNFAQVNALIDGIVAQADIVHVDLQATTGQRFVRGTDGLPDVLFETFELTHISDGGEETPVGTMRVSVSLTDVFDRLRSQFFELLLSNFVKTLLASMAMLFIFDRLVSRHLRSVARQLKASDWKEGGAPVALRRPGVNFPDELDSIVEALNESWRRNAASATDEITLMRDRLELVLNAATSAIVALDSQGRVVMTNNRARHMLGGISTEVPFDWPPDIRFLDAEAMVPLDASADPVRRALAGQTLRGETHLMRRAQRGPDRRYVRIDSTRLDGSEDGIALVLVMDDVSDEERNRQVVERKSRLDALGQLTGGIAHDFNNLLAAMLYALDLAERTDDPNKQARYMTTAQNAISRGRELTSRLLAFARRQPGLATSRQTADIFNEFEKLIGPMIEEQVTIRFASEGLGLQVYCDQAQLETALMNLVLNSRDAILRSGEGSWIDIRARAVNAPAQALEDGQNPEGGLPEAAGKTYRYVELAISDNGPGMDAETQSRSTDPFFTTKDSNSGTGLGLAMVYGFVRQSNGDLRIYSELGIGTTVRMTLPRGTVDGAREEPVQAAAVKRGKGETILLVEDERPLLQMMTELLQEMNYRVLPARSGSEALDVIQSGKPIDLLLTDVVMPGGIGGFELALRVREMLPDVPIIYTSGYTGFNLADMEGAEAVLLQKPASPAAIGAAIAQALNPV